MKLPVFLFSFLFFFLLLPFLVMGWVGLGCWSVREEDEPESG